MTLQGFSSNNLQGLYRNLQAFGIKNVTPADFLPWGICVYDDKVYVTDHATDSVIVFDTVGTLLDTFGTTGTGDGEFTQPMDIVTDGSYLYLYDNTRIMKHEFDGTFVDSISNPSSSMFGLFYTGSGIAASYYTSSGSQSNIRTYDSDFSVIRNCNTIDPPGPLVYDIFHLAGKVVFLRGDTHVVFNGDVSGSVVSPVTSDPDYIGFMNAPSSQALPLGDNGDEIFYKGAISSQLYKYNTTTSSPFISTNIGSLGTNNELRKVFYYNSELYGAVYGDDIGGSGKIIVMNPSDATVDREWTS